MRKCIYTINLIKMLYNLALLIEKELKKTCPVKTGKLKDSIKVIKDGNDYIIVMEDYWKQVEYTSVPFVRLMLNTKIPEFIETLKK